MRAMKLGALGLLLAAASVAAPAMPALAAAQKLTVTVEGGSKGKAIPADNAFCVPAAQGHATLGPDKSPKTRRAARPPTDPAYPVVLGHADGAAVSAPGQQ